MATRGELISGGARLLAAALGEDSRREALAIWAAMEGIPVGRLQLAEDAEVDAAVAARWHDRIARRAAGEPFQYVAESAGFRNLVVRSDRRALIPRPETELLVDLALARVSTGTAVDVGTGTGVLALALRQEGRFDRVIGIDLSPEALSLARENGVALGLEVDWRQGDLLAPLGGMTVDLIVSNPPYLTEAELYQADPSVRDWEPAMALASGPDGMSAIARLLEQGRRHLEPGGWLAMEVDSRRAGRTAELAELHGWHDVSVVRDLFDRDRFVLARHGGSE